MTHVFRQSRAKRAPRRLFGVLIVCWLNLTLLPCAIAFESDEHCVHMAAEQRPDCDMVSAECCDLADAVVDGRSGKFEFSADDLFAHALAPSWPALQLQVTSIDDGRPPDRGRRFTPRHVLHCVYLK